MSEQTETTENAGTGSLFDSMTTVDAPTAAELAIVSEQPLGLNAFNEGDIDFGSDDISIPRIKLTQALTIEVADGLCDAGYFFTPGFEQQKELHVIPLAFARRRILIDADTNEAVCKSGNSLTGVGVPGGECAKCPMNQWTGEAPSRKPPVCAFMYSYIIYVREWQVIGIMDFKRTNINAGKVINTLVSRNGLKTFAVQLTITQQKNKKGQPYFSTQVKPTATEPEELSTASQMFSLTN